MGNEEHRFPCETCGSDLRFDPGESQLICDHCGNTEPIENGPWNRSEAVVELDFRSALKAGLGTAEIEEHHTSSCPNSFRRSWERSEPTLFGQFWVRQNKKLQFYEIFYCKGAKLRF